MRLPGCVALGRVSIKEQKLWSYDFPALQEEGLAHKYGCLRSFPNENLYKLGQKMVTIDIFLAKNQVVPLSLLFC